MDISVSPDPDALKGQLCVIAGGLGALATSTSKMILGLGADVALLYPPFESKILPDVMSEYTPNEKQHIKTYECDIVSESSVNSTFERLNQDNPNGADILINAAGYIKLIPLEEASLDLWKFHMDVNVTGPFLCGNSFEKWCTKLGKKKARIVSISSQAAHVALPHHGPYCASKAALQGLIRSQASEWASRGITSNSVSPTVVWTRLGKEAWSGPKGEEFRKQIPTGRFTEPDEVARCIVFLAKDTGSINGADIRIDGGFTIV